jgi:hypothetical protein
VSGFVHAPDGSCVPSCVNRSCGARRACDESSGAPICVCQAGYAGADCASCAPGYAPDPQNRCVMVTLPAGTTLIGAGVYQGTQQLFAINTSAGSAIPVRPMPSPAPTQLAADAAGKTVWAMTATGISKLDLATGALMPLASLSSSTTLTFGAGALYTVPSLSPYLLKRVDPSTGAVADLGPTMIANAMGLAFEGPGRLLLARPRNMAPGWGPELYRLEGSNGAATMLGAVPFEATRLRPGDTRLALAIEPRSGHPFVVARVGRTPEEILTDHCHALAVGLGLAGYDTAPLTAVEFPYAGIGAGGSKTIGSTRSSGPEILAYASYGRAGVARATLQIATSNPDAFVCLSTYEEVLGLQIAATARFAGVVMSGYRPSLTLAVDSGFPATTKPLLHVYAATTTGLDPSVRAYAVSRVYTQQEWNERRLPVYASVWDSDPMAPVRLLELDPTTWAPLRMITFPGVELLPMLAPWGQ